MHFYTAPVPHSSVIKEMDELLLNSEGLVRSVPANSLEPYKQYLAAYGNMRGVYTFITDEQVAFCKEQISNKSALEINVGNCTLYRSLGIRGIDNFHQLDEETLNKYKVLNQVPTTPGSDVIKMDAVKAVNLYKPEIVIGCYVTQFVSIEENMRGISGNPYGPREYKMLSVVKKYIHFGNLGVHGDKKILRFPHKTYKFPWHFTRSINPEDNIVHIWG